nr:RHS repeat domain-containing protein [Solirubrum puertoriconensis]
MNAESTDFNQNNMIILLFAGLHGLVDGSLRHAKGSTRDLATRWLVKLLASVLHPLCRLFVPGCFLLGFIIVPKTPAAGQNGRSFQDHQPVVPSPQVAALGRFGTVPVSYHTGVPNISVPLHTIQLRGLAVPLALGYHSTGLQVDMRASDVGLGWSLTGAGVIGRVIRGLPDFQEGYATGRNRLRVLPFYDPLEVEPNDNSLIEYCRNVSLGTIDTEPDVYTYSFAGRSGKFVFDTLGRAHPIPYENLRIERFTGSNPEEEGFSIIDEAGNQFTFGFDPISQAQFTESTTTTQGQYCQGGLRGRRNLSGKTGYFLTRIITAYQDTVTFTYVPSTATYTNPVDLTVHELAYSESNSGLFQCAPITNSNNCYSTTNHFTYALASVTHGRETVTFSYEPGRWDLVDGAALREVVVRYAGVEKQRFTLFHSYFLTPGAGAPPPSASMEERLAISKLSRLRLDSVRQQGTPAYHFAYNAPDRVPFPPIHSYAQDAWGYYNGHTENATLVPLPNNTGANRSADPVAQTVGMLRRIRYPTGGTSTFTFEAHQVNNVQLRPGQWELLAGASADANNNNPEARHSETFTLTETKSVRMTYRFPEAYSSGGTSPGTGVPTGNHDPLPGSGGTTFTGGNGSVDLRSHDGFLIYSANSSGGTGNGHAPEIISLQPGTYVVTARAMAPYDGMQSGQFLSYSSSITLEEYKVPPPLHSGEYVGGCRIKQIVTDGQTPYGPAQRTTYGYVDSLGHSTGYLLSRPNFQTELRQLSTSSLGSSSSQNACIYYAYLQSSASEVGTTAGSTVSYGQVHVTEGDQTGPDRSMRRFDYSSSLDITRYSNSYPFPPPTSFEWLRGRLLRETDYKFVDAAYQRVRTKTYVYQENYTELNLVRRGTPRAANEAAIPGFRVYEKKPGDQSAACNCNTNPIYEIIPYYYHSASAYLVRTSETLWQNGVPYTTAQRLAYDDHNLQVKEERRATGGGDTLVTRRTFAHNYAVGAASHPSLAALRHMQQAHITTPVVETIQSKIYASGQEWELGRQLSEYRLLPQRQVLNARQHDLQRRVQWRGFSSAGPDSLRYDPAYRQRQSISRADRRGNPTQVSAPGAVPTSFLYGYHDRLVIAKAVAAAREDIACTSFEPVATGGWSFALGQRIAGGRTGKWAYRLVPGDALTARGGRNGSYTVSAWVQGGEPQVRVNEQPVAAGRELRQIGSWRLVSWTVVLPAGATVSFHGHTPLVLDDVRLYPAGALVTTYTHDPLVGVTSQTDASHRTTTYEFDAIGRLVRARDEQGRILSENEYRYAQH